MSTSKKNQTREQQANLFFANLFEDECGASDASADESDGSVGSLEDFIVCDDGPVSCGPPPRPRRPRSDSTDSDDSLQRPLQRRRVMACSSSSDSDSDSDGNDQDLTDEGPEREPEPAVDFPIVLSDDEDERPPTHREANGEVEEPATIGEDTGKRARRFSCVLNNYTPAEEACFREAWGQLTKFRIFGKEVAPTTGTPHLQAYWETKSLMSIKGLHKKIAALQGTPSRWGIKVSIGDGASNVAYCSKDGDVFQEGVVPKGQGKRSDIMRATEAIDAGLTMKEVALANPACFVKHNKGLQTYLQVTQQGKRTAKTAGYWFWGPTGTGKSHVAHSLSPDSTFVKDGMSKWFCGYNQEDTVIIDDFRPNKELPFSFLLRLADKYAMTVEAKGGGGQFNSKRIVITTPHSIDQTFEHLEFLKEGDIAQLKRRFKQVEFGEHTLSKHLTLQTLEEEAVEEDPN